MKKTFLIIYLIVIVIAPLAQARCFCPAFAYSGFPSDYRLDFDPADLKLVRIENVNGEPFSASIKNISTGREYEYFKGDYIGSLEVFSIATMQVELRHRLSRQRYILALPVDRVDRYAERSYRDQAQIDYEQALLYYKSGDSSSAIELLKKAARQRPDFEDALFFTAYIYHESNFYAEAFDYYNQVMGVNPRNYKCLYNIAEIQAVNGKINDAVFTLKKCLRLRPDYQKALTLMARINEEIEARNKKAKAAKEYSAAREREIASLKKAVTQYAENIKQLEAALDAAKKSKGDVKSIESELIRYKLLYNNNTKTLEDLMQK